MKRVILAPRILRAAVLVLCGGLVVALYADAISHGKEIFNAKCSKCHTLDTDKEGPRLRGVYGRQVATVPSFQYSDSLKGAKFKWDDTTLNKWLTDPDAMVPDNDMAFHLESASDRKAVIAYLKSLSGK